jgi:hypothetical protein
MSSANLGGTAGDALFTAAAVASTAATPDGTGAVAAAAGDGEEDGCDALAIGR